MIYLFDKKYPHFIIPPKYTGLTPEGYGSGMKVVLGPGAGIFYAGTKTDKSSLSGIMTRLVNRDGSKKWVAGHLLNGELGGYGTQSRNLCALTQTANKIHSGLELRVKRLCIKMRQWHEMNKNVNYFLGVRYTVEVVGKFGDFSPYKYCPSHLVVSARVYRYNKTTGLRSNLSEAQKAKFQFDSFKRRTVHNRDEHLV